MDFMTGAMIARKELMDLKDKAGVDVMEGALIPESDEDPIWAKLSFKDKEETIMQIILNEMIISEKMKLKLSDDVLNATITSMMFSKVERDEEGETRFISIDPREAIYERIKGDYFFKKSPILGSCLYMSVHDVLKRFKLEPKQIELLNSIAENPTIYTNRSNGGVRMVGGNLMIQVMHIEWKSVLPTYFKKMLKTTSQLAMDDNEKYMFKELDTDEYENNKDKYDFQVAKGDFEISVKYAEDLWEATRIGGLKELDVNCRRALFQMRKVDDPTRIFGSSYTGFICQNVDGKMFSLMNELDNLSNVFDITMYKILQDINKAIGKILGFNRAALGKDKTVKQVMYDAVNNSFVEYDTSASGNFHGRDVSLNNILQDYDLGLSSSFPSLVAFKDSLLFMMDRMTGINENREGQISASATVANTDSAITASRTITAPFFYGVYLYVSEVLEKVVESTKVTWAFYKIEKGEQILGTSKQRWLQVSQELGFKDYGVHIQDGSKYAKITSFMDQQMATSLNAKEIRPEDAFSYMIAETFSEKKAILNDAWSKVKQFTSEQQQMQLQAQQQMSAQQQQTQIQLAQEDREDKQKAAMDEIEWKATNQIRIDDNKGANNVIETQHKVSTEQINNTNI
jgi:hypothetical protein